MRESLRLDPLLSQRVSSLLEQRDLLFSLTAALGRPLNIVLPQQAADNVQRFQDVLQAHSLPGDVLYAHKTNRSSALLRELAATVSGADCASLAELGHALASGFAASRIVAGGPKNDEFIWLALRSGATISADSLTELATIATLADRHGLAPAKVSLRLSGFSAPGVQTASKPSRFGIPFARLAAAITFALEHRGAIEIVGLAFHLDTTSIAEKVVAIDACLRGLDQCRMAGLDPQALDIGGGYKVNYLRDRAQWEHYTTSLRQAVLGNHPPITWNGNGFGLRNDGGKLAGGLAVYNYYDPLTADGYLGKLLSEIAPSFGRPVSTLLLENLYRLQIEPGRALLDQCGVTVSRVLDTWTTGDGDHLVRLEMNRNDLTINDTEVFVDPVVIPKHDGTEASDPTGAYFIGNLCMESDFITRRKVFLDRAPQIGDLVVFVNTAGYFMDFSADSALQQPIARKVAAWENAGSWHWCLDEEYWPIWRSL